jgi:NAD(P)-dependent dehydrogenase (short-subunit alcohol dehydrogenase family)
VDLDLGGRTAFVTGGADGIGLAIAAALSREGARVAIADISAERLASAVELLGGDTLAIEADLSTAAGVGLSCEAVASEFGQPPDLLVNNVGRSSSRGFGDLTDEDWYSAFALNFMSYVRTSRALIPQMAANRGGAVVNIASDLAKQPERVPADYGCMKTAILSLTKVLALEFAPTVRVNAVLPGPVWTSMWHEPGGLVDRMAAEFGTDREGAVARYTEDRQLIMGMAQPEEVADAVLFLLSSRATRINGAAFDTGGTIRGLF